MNIHRKKERFLADLRNKPLSLVFSKWILEKTPYIFDGNKVKEIEWKEELSKKLGVDSHALSIIGSAALGFSLNPNKKFRYFNEKSDIDVAIISHHHFEIGWVFLRSLGTGYYNLNPKQKASVEDHRKRLIYWGTLATDNILTMLPFGKLWFESLTKAASVFPINDRDINIRLYRDYESLRAYHVMNLEKIRQNFYS